MAPARVGLLGGTFNPPHLGHLICASQACEQLGLDRVELLVAATPPHKEVPDDPGVEHRLAMCRLAVEDDERLGVNDIETRREGPSFTVDTLRALDGRDDLTFIVGGDMARTLAGWREPQEILARATLGVAEREGIGRAEIAEALAAFPSERIRFFAMPRIDLSSTVLRERVRAGRTLRHLVPDRVGAYVEREGLYT